MSVRFLVYQFFQSCIAVLFLLYNNPNTNFQVFWREELYPLLALWFSLEA